MGNKLDLIKGLVFTATGALFSVGAYSYGIGSNTNMGAGYFPFWLGLMLVVLGIVAVVKSIKAEAVTVGIGWQQLAFVFVANLILGMCLGGVAQLGIPALGLLVGIPAMVAISLFACNRFSVTDLVLKSSVFSIITYILFVVVLKLQIPMLPVL